MTKQQHPITPPPELVQQLYGLPQMRAIEKAYQAGADQKLEACCSLLELSDDNAREFLQSARRLKSEKQQALEDLDRLIALIPTEGAIAMAEPIRRALEALPDD